jgi:hypothetical protein
MYGESWRAHSLGFIIYLSMQGLTTLLLKIPRNTEVTPEAAQTLLSTLTSINSVSGFSRLMGERPQVLSLEIALINQQIHFLITCDSELIQFIKAQLRSNYPLVIMEEIEDPIAGKALEVSELSLRKGNYYAIATYANFTEIDPLASVLTILSKGDPDELTIIQYALQGSGSSWQSSGSRLAETGGGKTEEGKYLPHPDATAIKEKISYPGFLVSVRIGSNSKQTLNEIKSAFGVFTKSDGNSFTSKKYGILGKPNLLRYLMDRRVSGGEVLNIVELATLWHLPSDKIKITSIVWGSAVLSEPPENLPIAEGLSDEEKMHINFFAKTQFKNKEVVFGIKDIDRARHIWGVGKSGTGKSTMIENMVVDDLKKGRGVGLIDPHGDSCEALLNYIPSNRINDTIYFNPADKSYPIVINPLEVVNREEAELVVSGIMSVFTKVWANVWSARMEYILRNSLLTLAQQPDTTLSDVLRILSDNSYRNHIVQKTEDSNLVRFWREEYDKMPDRLQKEAISPIQNKVGQFVTSPMIRRIIGYPKSTIQLDEIMNQGKIILCNLSQGRLGEDNSSLLGAVLITKFQLAAMRRVDTNRDLRKPYYLYVDEFQNFATESFIKILSEARKYGLNLMLANQYMSQIPEEVQKAILGNAGTLISFTVGAEDAEIIHKEFSEVFSQNDLVNLARFQIAIKLLVDSQTSRPFLANTLPLPLSVNQNREKVLSVSRERWAMKPEEIAKHDEILRAEVEKQHQAHQQQNQQNRNDNDREDEERHERGGRYNNYRGQSGGYRGGGRRR